MLTTSAPGKLMLFGEHAVVYGQPCIVTAVNERLHVRIELADTLQLETPHANDTRFLEATINTVKKRFGLTELNVKISTHNGFAAVKGFGSSSAVTVATIQAIALFTNHQLSSKELFDMAYEAVLSVQGVGSGFDVAAAAYGGTLFFTKGGQTINRLIDGQQIPLVIGYTGVKADTAAIVKEVATKREQQPERVDRIFQAIGELVIQANEKLQQGDWERVGKLMDFNQDYLRDLGVSSEKLEALISAAKKAGAQGAKLSGAGRGDCMLAITDEEHRSGVVAAIREAGGEVISVAVNAPGVKVDTTDDQTEQFVVVDPNDNVLGYRSRYDCHHDKSLIHRSIGILIFDTSGRVLLQKRSLSKDTNPGKWSDSVGGHVMKDETYEQSARREIQEELGIAVVLKLHSKFILEYPWETEMEALFTGTCDGPFHPNSEEVAETAFMSKDELSKKISSGEMQLTECARKSLQKVGFLS